jgi:RNA polymerase sigma-70 factor (ECF subfamily)
MILPVVKYTQNSEEHRLVRQVADGDSSAFKRLFDTHSEQVYNLSLKLLTNRDDAEELTQDVFFTLWRKAGEIRGDSALSTWLYRVTFNKAMNIRKRGGAWGNIRRFFSIEQEPEMAVTLEASPNTRPDRQREIAEARTTLAELLSSLPGRQGEIFALHKLQGMSYKEIAAELGLSLSAVEAAMHRARTNLQKAMLKKHQKSHKK